jgi:anthranilate 1,2-dioxygenase large subunit
MHAQLRTGQDLVWNKGEFFAVPDEVYTDPAIFEREQHLIFEGPTWNFVGLEAELPQPGDYKRSHVGSRSVVVARGADGTIAVFENRCAHRGAEFCRLDHGHAESLVCPYHQWSYGLDGSLQGIPFRRGVGGQGGMNSDFKPAEHAPRRLAVTTRGGTIFASYSHDMPDLPAYLGPDVTAELDAVFSGRPIKILGHTKNRIPGNWKMYHENLKDPYHATLLHSFLVSFNLLVAGQKSRMICDESGLHGAMVSAKGDSTGEAVDTSQMRSFVDGLSLREPGFLDFVREFNSPWSVAMSTIWPNLIIQRELNTLGVRQIVPRSPDVFELHWTNFGYGDDDDAMQLHRLKQGNLMGPSGFLGIEDNEAIKFVQEGLKHGKDSGVLALGGQSRGSQDTLISEAAIRSMYTAYRACMGL